MTPHDKSIKIIEALEYNAQRVSEIIGVARKTADHKIKQINYNKFTEKQYDILREHAENKIKELSEVI